MNLKKLGDFVGESAKLWNISRKFGKCGVFFKNALFSKVCGYDFFYKTGAKKFKFDLDVPLHGSQNFLKQNFEIPLNSYILRN